MIGSSKKNRENYLRKCFGTQEKETQVNFNRRLSTKGYGKNYSSLHYTLFRYGSRINNDRFPEQAPKEQAVKQGHAPQGNFFWILGFLSYSDNNYIY